MNTEDLIARLAGDLRPVRPLASPWSRATTWLAFAAVYVAAVAGVVFVLRARLAATANPVYLVGQVASIATGVAGAVAAFTSVVPGASRRLLVAPVITIAVWVAAIAAGSLRDLQVLGTAGFGAGTDWPCVLSITAGGVLLWGGLAAMLRRGAPVRPATTALLAAAAALGIANVEACLTRPHAFNATVLVWHGATIAALAIAMQYAGPFLFRWPRLDRTWEA